MKHFFGFIGSLAVLLPVTASAQDAPKLEGTYKDWTSYSRSASGDKSCYAVTPAKTKSPSSVDHGEIYFIISSWKSGAATEQPNFLASYPLNPNIPPEAKVRNTKASFYVAGNEAFIEESSHEKRLVKAMRAGSTMTVSAQSQRGTRVSYSFSLSGATAALKKMKEACR
ncbi:MAG: invasion associated locus B family protein [Maricaulaceae bacterium]